MNNFFPTRLTRPVLIGLVGGIASGKSHVASLFEQLGAQLINADRLAHSVLRLPDVQAQLIALLGTSIRSSDGELDRSQIAKLVFGDSEDSAERLRSLNKIVHPRVRELAEKQIETARQLDFPPVAMILDAPLLLEAGWESICDLIVFVDAERQVRLARAKERGWTEQQFAAREATQMPVEEKLQRATHVLKNNGQTSDKLDERVKLLWDELSAATKEARFKTTRNDRLSG